MTGCIYSLVDMMKCSAGFEEGCVAYSTTWATGAFLSVDIPQQSGLSFGNVSTLLASTAGQCCLPHLCRRPQYLHLRSLPWLSRLGRLTLFTEVGTVTLDLRVHVHTLSSQQ